MAGTTTTFAIPYPSSTDYVTDGATAMRTLADQVDAVLNSGTPARNILMNGAMQVAQRGTTFTFGAGGGDSYYGADRWRTQDYTWTAGSNITVSNDTSVVPTGHTNSYKVATGATGLTFGSGGTLFIETAIEGYDAKAAYGKSCYLSFWVRSSVAGIYNLLLENGTWGNGTTTRIYTPEYTIITANAWEYKTIPINFVTATASGTWATTTSKGLGVSFILGAHADRTGNTYKDAWTTFSTYSAIKTTSAVSWGTNANATFNVTGVQLTASSVPVPFQFKNYADDLRNCQRYYCVVASGSSFVGNAVMHTTDAFESIIHLPAVMRTAPTLVATTGASYYGIYALNVTKRVDLLTNASNNLSNLRIYGNLVSTTSTAGVGAGLYLQSASASIAASAEL